jgi:hypothetical protein
LQLEPLGEGALWCVDPRTVVLRLWWDGTTFEEAKKALPLGPGKDLESLPGALREALVKRLPRGTLVWVAGHDVPAPMIGAVLPFVRGAKESVPLLKPVRTFDTGLRFAKDVALIGDLECTNAKSAAALARFLRERKLGALGAPTVAAPAAEEKEHYWVSFQLRAHPEALRATLKGQGRLLPNRGP